MPVMYQLVWLPLWVLKFLRLFWDLPPQRPLEKTIEDLREENRLLRDLRGLPPAPVPESALEKARREADEEVLRLERLLNPVKDYQEAVNLGKALFEPLQNLRRALESDGEGVVDGVRMTLAQFEAVLKAHRFQPIEPLVGDPFDPRTQEAVDFMKVLPDLDGCVVRTLAVGYWYDAVQSKVLLLPAKVIVGRYS